jgi:hypothetical protein
LHERRFGRGQQVLAATAVVTLAAAALVAVLLIARTNNGPQQTSAMPVPPSRAITDTTENLLTTDHPSTTLQQPLTLPGTDAQG